MPSKFIKAGCWIAVIFCFSITGVRSAHADPKATPNPALENYLVNLMAAEQLNKKFSILSVDETKEFEWRNANIIDGLKQKKLVDAADAKEGPIMERKVNAIIGKYGEGECALCQPYVAKELANARNLAPGKFEPKVLVQYDMALVPRLYVATLALEKCSPEEYPLRKKKMDAIDAELISEKFQTQDTIDKTHAVAEAASKNDTFDCSNPYVIPTQKLMDYRINRLQENLDYYKQKERESAQSTENASH